MSESCKIMQFLNYTIFPANERMYTRKYKAIFFSNVIDIKYHDVFLRNIRVGTE